MSARSAPALPLTAEPIRPGVWRVASSRPGEADYTVGWNGASGGSCTCPGFQRWQHCRHLDYVRTRVGPAPAPRKERPMQTNPRALQRVEPPALPVEEPSRALANLTVQDVAQLADRLARAQGFLPKGITEPAQVFAIVLTGQEVGIGPMAALRHIPMVEGKPDPSAELLLALIRHRYGPATIRVAESTADHCTVEWRQPGWDGVQAFTWTVKDSERAGLTKKFNHQAYPAAMNRARAIKFVARSHFPEVALGLDLGGEESAADAPVRYVQDSPAGAVKGGPAPAGLLTADELAPGGVYRGERGGILEGRDAVVPLASDELAPGGVYRGTLGDLLGDREPAVGEVVGLTECASCGTVAECVCDGEAYICADNAACVARSTLEPQMQLEAVAPPEDTAQDPNLVSSKQLESIRAHLERTGRSEAALVDEFGHPLERLLRADASALLRDLGKVANKAPKGAAEEVAF